MNFIHAASAHTGPQARQPDAPHAPKPSRRGRGGVELALLLVTRLVTISAAVGALVLAAYGHGLAAVLMLAAIPLQALPPLWRSRRARAGGGRMPPALRRQVRRTTGFAALAVIAAIAAMPGPELGADGPSTAFAVLALVLATVPWSIPGALAAARAVAWRRLEAAGLAVYRGEGVEALALTTLACIDRCGLLTTGGLTPTAAMMPEGRRVPLTADGEIDSGESSPARAPGARPDPADRAPDDPTLAARAGVLWRSLLLSGPSRHGSAAAGRPTAPPIDDRAQAHRTGRIDPDRSGPPPTIPSSDPASADAAAARLSEDASGGWTHVSGRPEVLLDRVQTMRLGHGTVSLDRQRIEAQVAALTTEGLHVVAVARRRGTDAVRDDASAYAELDTETGTGTRTGAGPLELLGLVAFADPLQADVKAALDAGRRAGIRFAVLTDDHPAAALAQAEAIGLNRGHQPAVTGEMISRAAAAGEPALDNLVRPARVFARLRPGQRALIVDSFHRDAQGVALTGARAADVPALIHSDTGIALLDRADAAVVAAADLGIARPSVARLLRAIALGRGLRQGVTRALALWLAPAAALLLLVGIAAPAGLVAPLAAAQIVWLWLTTRALPELCLACQTADGTELDGLGPTQATPLLGRAAVARGLLDGTIMALFAGGCHQWLRAQGVDAAVAGSAMLTALIALGAAHALLSRCDAGDAGRRANPMLIGCIVTGLAVHLLATAIPAVAGPLGLTPLPAQVWPMLAATVGAFMMLSGVRKPVGGLLERRTG